LNLDLPCEARYRLGSDSAAGAAAAFPGCEVPVFDPSPFCAQAKLTANSTVISVVNAWEDLFIA